MMVERKGRTGTMRSTGTGRENDQNTMPVEKGRTKKGRKVSGRAGCVRNTEEEQQRLIKVKKKKKVKQPPVLHYLTSPVTKE